jgi:hypothetical protein
VCCVTRTFITGSFPGWAAWGKAATSAEWNTCGRHNTHTNTCGRGGARLVTVVATHILCLSHTHTHTHTLSLFLHIHEKQCLCTAPQYACTGPGVQYACTGHHACGMRMTVLQTQPTTTSSWLLRTWYRLASVTMPGVRLPTNNSRAAFACFSIRRCVFCGHHDAHKGMAVVSAAAAA